MLSGLGSIMQVALLIHPALSTRRGRVEAQRSQGGACRWKTDLPARPPSSRSVKVWGLRRKLVINDVKKLELCINTCA